MGKKILNDSSDPDFKEFIAYARTLIVPLIVMKIFILYFGLNYSRYPGDGYGYGLIASLALTLTGFAYFLWAQSRR